MAERLGSPENILPAELQKQLNFEVDPSGEWFFNDELTPLGGIDHGEWLPARTRVSKDGTRYEVGSRVQDLEGMLELNRLIRPNVKTVETVINFWKDHPKFAARKEDEWVYIGANIEPTPEGLETEFDAINFAYDCALESAISGRTYEELAQDEKWYGDLIKQIEKPGEGRTGLFGRKVEPEEDKNEKHGEDTTCRRESPITAENLKDFPLDTYRTSLHRVPGTLAKDGRTKELKGMWVIAHNGQETVDMIDSDAKYVRSEKKWVHDDTRLKLPIPEGVEIRTVADLAKLKKMQVFGENWKLAQELGVEITVKDNSFRVVSGDGAFSMEVRTLACTNCQLPSWKFRWPNKQEAKEDFDPYKEFSMHSTNTGAGGYQCHVTKDDGQKDDVYCFDCVKKLETTYLQDHPTARRSTTIEITKAKLAEAGYPDVKIWDKQVWRTKDNGWQLFTYIEYERDEKTIRRHTGIPTITDDGHFKLNIPSREYIDFRYKT